MPVVVMHTVEKNLAFLAALSDDPSCFRFSPLSLMPLGDRSHLSYGKKVCNDRLDLFVARHQMNRHMTDDLDEQGPSVMPRQPSRKNREKV